MASSIGPCDFCKKTPARTRSLQLHRRPIDGAACMICGGCRQKIRETAAAAKVLARRLGLPWRPTVGRVEEFKRRVSGDLLDVKDELARLLGQLSAFENGEPDPDRFLERPIPAVNAKDPCERCEENEAEIKLIASDLDGVVLDGPERVCRICATDAGFMVGK